MNMLIEMFWVLFILLNLWLPLKCAQSQVSLDLTENCRIHYNRYLAALETKEPWADQMLDGSGRVESGISGGNLVFEGDYSTCQKVSENTSNANAVKGLYCMITWYDQHKTADADTKGFGFCIPQSCRDEDARIISHLYNPHKESININLSSLYCLRAKNVLADGGALLTILLLVLFGLAVTAGTVLDVVYSTHGKLNHQTGVRSTPGLANGSSKHSNSLSNHCSTVEQDLMEGTIAKLLLCFSLYTNIPRLVSTKHVPGSYTFFNGIRFLAMTWILLGHTYFFGIYHTANLTVANRYNMFPKGFGYELIHQMVLSVESFFILSSILAAMSFMETVDKHQDNLSVRQVVLYYVHRYWRLTPVYAVVLLFYHFLLPYLGNGPLFTHHTPDHTYCKGRLWQKMIYVDNLMHTYQECSGWTWYMTFDFQYFVISPLFLYPAYWVWKRKKAPVWAALIILTGYLGSLLANVILNLMSTYGKLTESWVHAVSHRPWTRATSYFLGMTLGYCLYITKAKIRLTKHTLVLGWALCAVLLSISIFGNHFITWPHPDILGPQLGAALFMAVRTTLFALAVLWIVLICFLGQGGLVNTILSWNIWVPLARLTYVSYLVHPIFQLYFSYSSPVQIYVYGWLMMYLFLGHLVLSLAAAFVITLVFEMPFLNMDKVILKLKKKAKIM